MFDKSDEASEADPSGRAPSAERWARFVLGAEHLITAKLLRELALTAEQVPLIHPGYGPPEPQRTPSKALEDFVRARDLTCRWPGCDVPAIRCDLDREDGVSLAVATPSLMPRAGPPTPATSSCYCRTQNGPMTLCLVGRRVISAPGVPDWRARVINCRELVHSSPMPAAAEGLAAGPVGAVPYR